MKPNFKFNVGQIVEFDKLLLSYAEEENIPLTEKSVGRVISRTYDSYENMYRVYIPDIDDDWDCFETDLKRHVEL